MNVVMKCDATYCRDEAFLGFGGNQLMFFLHSQLRDVDKKVKTGNCGALLIKAFTVINEYGVRRGVFWTIKSNS